MSDLTWKGRTPVSSQFDDVYFSAEDGVAETEHVFLAGNGLPQRFAEHQCFTIGELGFGTGLNFLVALQSWLTTHRDGDPDRHFNFISCEKFPLKESDMEICIANMPEGLPHKEDLLQFWRHHISNMEKHGASGWMSVSFKQGHLHLYLGDVSEMLAAMPYQVDAWFLDGFAPAKNPDMWGQNIYNAMARQSNTGATFATYTAAGHVRRGLEDAGFRVEKIRGFGHKRDMTVGQLCDKLIT